MATAFEVALNGGDGGAEGAMTVPGVSRVLGEFAAVEGDEKRLTISFKVRWEAWVFEWVLKWLCEHLFQQHAVIVS